MIQNFNSARNGLRSLITARSCILMLLLAGCGGGKNIAEDFEVILDSNSPLVRTTPRTVNGTEITANWFDLGFRVINKTEKSIRIEEVLTWVTVDGVESGPYTMDLGSLGSTNEDTGVTYVYSGYCTYPPVDRQIRFSACANKSTNPEAAPPDAIGIIMLVDGIPKPTSGDSLAFTSRTEFKGVVVDSEGRDVERFDKSIYFTTR